MHVCCLKMFDTDPHDFVYQTICRRLSKGEPYINNKSTDMNTLPVWFSTHRIFYLVKLYMIFNRIVWILYANSTLVFVTLFWARLTRKSGTIYCHVICCQVITADGSNILILVLCLLQYFFKNVHCRDGEFNKAGKVKLFLFVKCLLLKAVFVTLMVSCSSLWVRQVLLRDKSVNMFKYIYFREIKEEELQRFCGRICKLLHTKDVGGDTVDSLQRLNLIVSATKYVREWVTFMWNIYEQRIGMTPFVWPFRRVQKGVFRSILSV